MKKYYFLFFCLSLLLVAGISPKAGATHIMGGEITYRYLNDTGPAATPFTYRVTVKVYVDWFNTAASASQGSILNNPRLYIYNADDNRQFPDGTIQWRHITPNNSNLPRSGTNNGIQFNPIPQQVSPSLPAGCVPACLNDVRVAVNIFEFDLNVPFSANGYILFYEVAARNNIVLNLQNPGSVGNTFITKIPSPAFGPNSSPQFTDLAIPFMLTNDPTTIVNTAVDPDGDRLTYRFIAPYDGNNRPAPNPLQIPQTLLFNPTFSATQPFGPTGIANINPLTGVSEYMSPNMGSFVVTLEILEYRTLQTGLDTLIGSTRRELQFFVRESGNGPNQCPLNQTPLLFGAGQNIGLPNSLTITEGETVRFPVWSNDPNNDTINVFAAGDAFSSSFISGNLATFPNITGLGPITSEFLWNTSCGTRGQYAITIKSADKGCTPKTEAKVVLINVLPFKGAQTITGERNACGPSFSYTYTAPVASNGSTRVWKAIGGNIISQNTNSATVSWTTAGPTLRLITTSLNGCKDSLSINISNQLATKPVATNNVNICQGSQIPLSVTGGTGVYRWSPATGLSSTTIANPTAKPNKTTTYIVTSPNPQGCDLRDTVVVTVIPTIPNTPDTAVCSTFNGLIGQPSDPEYSYRWVGDTTGLTTTFGSRVNLNITNPSDTDVVKVYILSGLHIATNCLSFDTIRVRLRALPQVQVFLKDTTICSGAILQVGPASKRPNSVYTWNDSTFLDSIKVPTTFKPINHSLVSKEVLLVLSAKDTITGCENSDTLKVTVLPLPDVGVKDTVACDTLPLQMGHIALPNLRYTWQPATFLSSDTVSNPVFRYSGNVTAPVNLNYTYFVEDRVLGSCSFSKTITISVRPRPVADAGKDSTFCSLDSTAIGVQPIGGYAYQWSPTTGIGQPKISNPKIFLPNPADTFQTHVYTLTVTDTLSGCFRVDTVVFRIKPRTVVNASRDTTVCFGSSIQIGDSPIPTYSYSWNRSVDISDSTLSNPLYSANKFSFDAIIDTLVLTAFNPGTGCTNRDTLFVKIQANPRYNFTDNALCSGDSILLGDTAQPGFTYSWFPGLGLSDSTIARPKLSLINGSNDTSYFVKYKVTITNDTTGCVTELTRTIEIRPRPINIPGPSGDTLCSDELDSAGVASMPDTYTYNWFNPDGRLISTSKRGPIFWRNSADTIVRAKFVLEVTDPLFGCPLFDSTFRYIRPRPKTLLGTRDSLCSGDTVVIGTPIQRADDRPRYRFSWSPSIGLSDTTIAAPKLSLINTADTTQFKWYTLTVFDSTQGCSATDSIRMRIHPLPAKRGGRDTIACSFGDFVFGLFRIPDTEYQWTFLNGVTPGLSATFRDSRSSQAKIEFINLTQQDIKQGFLLTTTSTRTGCSSVDTVFVLVRTVPNAILNSGNDTLYVCNNEAFTLGVAQQDSISYLWDNTTGFVASTATQPTVNLKVNYTGLASDTVISYRLTATNDTTLCSFSDRVWVRIFKKPNPFVGTSDSSCSSVPVAIGPTTIAPNEHRLRYLWKPGAGLSDSTVKNPLFTGINTGALGSVVNKSYRLIIRDTLSGCVDSSDLNMRIYPLPTKVGGNDVTACSEAAAPVGIVAPAGPFGHFWSVPNLQPNVTGGFPAGSTGTPALVRFTSTATTVVQQPVVVRSVNLITGCSVFDTVVVNINPSPLAFIAALDTIEVCTGVPQQVGGFNDPNFTYRWSPGRFVSDSNLAQPNIILANPGNTVRIETLTLTVTNTITGCIKNRTGIIKLYPGLPFTMRRVDTLCAGNTIPVGVPNNPNYTYQWTGSSPVLNQAVSLTTYTNTTAPGTPPSNQDIVLEVTNPISGCIFPLRTTVTTISKPLAFAGNDGQACGGAPYLLGGNPVSGVEYQWIRTAGLTIPNVANPTVVFNNRTLVPRRDTLILRTVNIGVSAAYRCPNLDTVIITVNPNPIRPEITGGSSVLCPNLTNDVFTVDTVRTGYTYNWSVSGGTIVGGQGTASVNINWGAANPNAWVRVVAVSPQNCESAPDTSFININPTLRPDKPLSTPVVCWLDGTPVPFSTSGRPGSIYEWNWQFDSSGVRVRKTVPTTASFSIPFFITGNYKIWIREISQVSGNPFVCEGISDTTYIEVVRKPAPTLSMEGSTTPCLRRTSLYSLPGLPGSTYSWKIEPATGVVVTNQPNGSFLIRFNQLRNYTIKVVETSIRGCVGDTISMPVNVQPTPNPTQRAYEARICLQTLNNRTYAVNGGAGSRFNWVIRGGTIITPNTLNDTIIVDWDPITPKFLGAVEINSSGCPSDTLVFPLNFDRSFPELIQVTRRESADSVIDVKIDLGSITNIPTSNRIRVLRRAKGTANFTTLTNTLALSATSFTDVNPANNRTRIYEYAFEFTNACGTIQRSSVQNTLVMQGSVREGTDLVTLNWNSYNGWLSSLGAKLSKYEVWRQVDDQTAYVKIGESNKINGLPDTSFTADAGGDGFVHKYRIKALDSTGTRFAWSNIVRLSFENRPRQVNNVITPNVMNETLRIKYLELYPENEIIIYNRWGKEVFRTNNYKNDWDGGVEPPGEYFFFLRYKGRISSEVTGFVTIMR